MSTGWSVRQHFPIFPSMSAHNTYLRVVRSALSLYHGSIRAFINRRNGVLSHPSPLPPRPITFTAPLNTSRLNSNGSKPVQSPTVKSIAINISSAKGKKLFACCSKVPSKVNVLPEYWRLQGEFLSSNNCLKV